jgi:hypothetical protein
MNDNGEEKHRRHIVAPWTRSLQPCEIQIPGIFLLVPSTLKVFRERRVHTIERLWSRAREPGAEPLSHMGARMGSKYLVFLEA